MHYINKLILIVVAFFSLNNAFADISLNKYENLMIDKVWITTNAVNEKNEQVIPTNKDVSGFFGIAEYHKDGSFRMYTPEGKLKLSGDWSMSNDGKTRNIIAKKEDGTVLFTREVKNIKVEPNNYTYRIYPNSENKNIYFDIIHQPLSILLSK